MLWLFLAGLALAESDQPILGFAGGSPLNSLAAYDLGPDRCLLLGQSVFHMYVHGGPLVVSHDGGDNWHLGGSIEGAPTAVRVLDADTVFVLYEWQIEGVFPGMVVTHDGGKTWQEPNFSDAARKTGECCFLGAKAVRATDRSNWAIELDGHGWVETHDGGVTWALVASPTVVDRTRAGQPSDQCKVTTTETSVTVEAGGKVRHELTRRFP